MSEETVRVRYAPSPTGYPHIGNIRTALFNWLFARHSGGKFLVRIEDTDQTRKVEGAVESILDGLRWLGLDWDEGPGVGGDYGPYFQSERRELYQRYARQLLESGHAYKCYCSAERLARMRDDMAARKESMRSYDRHCRDLSSTEQARLEAEGSAGVIRFRVPLQGETTFHDLIRGNITFGNSELDDLVLLKSDGYPTYHLANIVDDHLMKISHVMRADEWLSSTPRHVLLYGAFGWEPPLYAHLPMILGPDKSKLSKRHGATSIIEYRDEGYLPEAMVNFLSLLGWALDDKTEILSRDDLIRHFSIERISKTAAIFSRDKLQWMNGLYLRQIVEKVGPEEFAVRALPFLEAGLPAEVKRPIERDYVRRIAPLVYERVNILSELPERASFFFVKDLQYDAESLVGKGLDREKAVVALNMCVEKLEGSAFNHQALESTLRSLADELGLKAGVLFGVIRVAVTGRTASPPLFETMEVLGKERCLSRLAAAVACLEGGRC